MVASAAAQQDTTAADAPAKVQMRRDSNSGVTSWSVEEGALNRELEAQEVPLQSLKQMKADPKLKKLNKISPAAQANTNELNGKIGAADEVEPVVPAEPEVLPAVSPEEQYRFALGRALQNDLETAERAFSEFRIFNVGHERQADATFWLGRVQFMRGEYEKAAMTFSEFNSVYPRDARLVDTTMWIAESVSHFAPPEQACEIYASLPKLLDTPPENFLT